MNKPNYSAYSLEELIECKDTINREAWPERYQEIKQRIQQITSACGSSKQIYKEIEFLNFCESLRDDLTLAFDDNLLGIFSFFSKRAKTAIPSTFQDEICPICQGELDVESSAWGWKLSCKSCEVSGIVQERASV